MDEVRRHMKRTVETLQHQLEEEQKQYTQLCADKDSLEKKLELELNFSLMRIREQNEESRRHQLEEENRRHQLEEERRHQNEHIQIVRIQLISVLFQSCHLID